MDETHQQPLRNQRGLPLDHGVQKRNRGIRSLCQFRVVTLDCVVRKRSQGLWILLHGGILKCANANVACCDARQDCARQLFLAKNSLTGGHDR
jgi:hypothetical protein